MKNKKDIRENIYHRTLPGKVLFIPIKSLIFLGIGVLAFLIVMMTWILITLDYLWVKFTKKEHFFDILEMLPDPYYDR